MLFRGVRSAAHPLLALTRARTRARRPGSPGRRALSRGSGYGMYGVWYAIGVTETWCSQTSAGPYGIFKVKWL